MLVLSATKTISATEEFVNGLLQKYGMGIVDFLLKMLLSLVVYFIGVRLIRFFCRFLRKNMEKFNLAEGGISFMLSFTKWGCYIILVFLIASLFGVEPTSLTALLASAGVAVSLALQGGLSNIAGGMIILLMKPFHVGDYIMDTSSGLEGTVKKIEMYYTTLATIDNQLILIPNSKLTNNSIINTSAMEKRKLILKVGISYEADIKLAKNLMKKLAAEDKRFLPEEQQFYVDELGDSAVILGMRAWVKAEDFWQTKWDMNEKIKLLFDESGIGIPYPQMDIHIREEAVDEQAR